MWTARWAVLCCLLCLAASSTTSCSWQALQEQVLTEERRQIDVRAKGSGTLLVTLVQQSGTQTNISTQNVRPPDPHTLAINLVDNNKCEFTLRQDKKLVWNNTLLMMEGFEKVVVTGSNLESCTGTRGEPEAGGGGADGGDQEGNVAEQPKVWVLALIAAGVAVTVASIAVFVWSLCGACRGGSSS